MKIRVGLPKFAMFTLKKVDVIDGILQAPNLEAPINREGQTLIINGLKQQTS